MNDKAVISTKQRFQKLSSVLTRNWDFMRWLRLGISLFLIWQLIQRPDLFTAIVAAIFLFQTITNTGCCGASGCAIAPKEKKDSLQSDKVEFEEVTGGKNVRHFEKK